MFDKASLITFTGTMIASNVHGDKLLSCVVCSYVTVNQERLLVYMDVHVYSCNRAYVRALVRACAHVCLVCRIYRIVTVPLKAL